MLFPEGDNLHCQCLIAGFLSGCVVTFVFVHQTEVVQYGGGLRTLAIKVCLTEFQRSLKILDGFFKICFLFAYQAEIIQHGEYFNRKGGRGFLGQFKKIMVGGDGRLLLTLQAVG